MGEPVADVKPPFSFNIIMTYRLSCGSKIEHNHPIGRLPLSTWFLGCAYFLREGRAMLAFPDFREERVKIEDRGDI